MNGECPGKIYFPGSVFGFRNKYLRLIKSAYASGIRAKSVNYLAGDRAGFRDIEKGPTDLRVPSSSSLGINRVLPAKRFFFGPE